MCDALPSFQYELLEGIPKLYSLSIYAISRIETTLGQKITYPYAVITSWLISLCWFEQFEVLSQLGQTRILSLGVIFSQLKRRHLSVTLLLQYSANREFDRINWQYCYQRYKTMPGYVMQSYIFFKWFSKSVLNNVMITYHISQIA